MTSFERSFTNVQFSPMVTVAGRRLDRETFVPSEAYADPSIWSVTRPNAREFTATGRFHGDSYVVVVDTVQPADIGAMRSATRLERLGRRLFRWRTSIEQAVGRLTVADVDRAVHAALAEAAGATGAALRAATTAQYPHTAVVLGRLLSLDSVRTSREPVATRVRLVIGLHVDRFATVYPNYAASLRTIIEPARIHSVATDADGVEWLRIDFDGARFVFELATTPAGRLAPLSGAPRAMPNPLFVHTDLSMKIWMLSAGMRDLTSRVTFLDGPHARGWRFAFEQEPKWEFPLALDRLVTSSLARPFADGGSQYEVVVADSVGATTLLQRRALLNVEESPIMSWLGRFSVGMDSAFSDTATAEQNEFFATVFAAARADVQSSATMGQRPPPDRPRSCCRRSP